MKNSSNGSNEQQSQNVHSENNNFVFPSNKSALNNHNKYDYDRDDFDIDEDQDENFNNRKRRPSSSNLDLKDTDLSKLQNSLLLQKTVSINNDFFNKKQIQEKQNVFDIQNSSNQQKRDIIQKNSEQQNKEAKKPKLRKKLKLRKVVKGQRDHRSKYNNNYPSQRANKYESQNRYQKKIPKNQKNQFQTWDDEDQTDKIYPLKNKREEENWPKQEYQKKREYNEDYQSVHKDSYRKKNRKNQYQKVKMKGFFELTEEFRRELKEQDKVKMIEQDIYSYLYSELWNKFSYILDYIKKFSQEREKGRRIMKQRLDIIVKKTLQNKFYVQEYGSAATQLLTPFSDLDLQIKSTNTQLQLDKETAKQVLQTIHENLQLEECSFVLNSQAILGANMPVLKITADANRNYQDTEITGEYEEVKIDVTVDLKDSFSLPNTSAKTTNFTKEQIERYPVFFDCVLLIKFVLSCSGLNESYKGGLNSYGLCLLFVAFLEANNLEQSKDHSQVFFQFLKFYGRIFDYKKQQVNLGVLLINKKNPFVNKRQRDNNLFIFDPCAYVEKNVTPNCFQIAFIFSSFDKIIQRVEYYQKIIEETIQNDLYSMSVDQLVYQIQQILPNQDKILKDIFNLSFEYSQIILKKLYKKIYFFELLYYLYCSFISQSQF